MSLKKIHSRRLKAGLALAAVFALSACASTAGSSSTAAQQPIDKKNIVLVASVINTTNPYMASMIQGAQALSKKLGVPLKIVDSNGSSQTEISKIQAILAEGKKVVLMVNTVASSDAPTIVNAVKAAGGFVTVWWNKPDNLEPWNVGNNFVAFQKHSGVESGKCTADALGKALNGKGNIIALPGTLDSTTSKTRVAGLEAALKNDYPNVHILEEQPGSWDQQVAFKVTQTLISKYGDKINGVWAADDGMMLGAIQAIKDSGRANEVKFASDGLYPPMIDLMKQKFGNDAIVGETFHRGYMAASIGLYTAYLAATGKLDVAKMTHEQRDGLFKLSCVTPATLDQFTKYDTDIDGWVDSLITTGPFKTEPVPLVAGGPEVMP